MNDSLAERVKHPRNSFCARYEAAKQRSTRLARRASPGVAGEPSTPAEAQVGNCIISAVAAREPRDIWRWVLYASFDAQLSGHLLYLARQQRAGRATPIYYRGRESGYLFNILL